MHCNQPNLTLEKWSKHLTENSRVTLPNKRVTWPFSMMANKTNQLVPRMIPKDHVLGKKKGKIGKIIPELLVKSQLHPRTFPQTKLVLKLLVFASVTSFVPFGRR